MMEEEIYPLSVVLDNDKFFGHYLEEILLVEGFPYFRTINLKDIENINSQKYPLLIFSEAEFNKEDIRNILSYVKDGGCIFLMKPNKEMREALNLEVKGEILDGYIYWENERALQFHGKANIYPEKEGLSVLAYLKEKKEKSNTGLGSFTLKLGKGKVGIFSFNLPKSILLTRQGNPEWRNSKGDKFGAIRPADLFYRLSGEKWIDPENTDIPQADFLQRFFVEQIISFSSIPLPRIWYFPNLEKVSFTIVGDSDGVTPEEARIETDLVKSYGGVYGIYLIDKTLNAMEKKDFNYLMENKDEVALHPNYYRVGNVLKVNKEKMETLYQEMIIKLEKKFGIKPVSMRHHSLVWCGWVDIPKIEEKFGISLDNNYGYPTWFGQKEYGGSKIGYITGSGQPQRFCDERGKLINVFQLEQELEDEILVPQKGLGLSGEETFLCLKDLIQKSQKGYYSYLVACFHPITVAGNPEAYKSVEMLLSFCQENKVPIRTLKEVAEFAKTRREIYFSSFRERNSLSFTISGQKEAIKKGITLLIPANKVEGIKTDGEKKCWPQETLGGRSYYWYILNKLPLQLKLTIKGEQEKKMNLNPFERARLYSKELIKGKKLPRELQIVQYQNGKIIKSSYPFRYENSNHPKLKELRERYNLDKVIKRGETEFQKFILLRNWVRSRWDHGWDHFKMKTPPKDALEILKEAEKGKEFTCGFYAKTFTQCALSLGYQARILSICKDISHIPLNELWKETNIGHSVPEIWSNEYNKWIIMDPDLNAYYEKDGVPLNAYEIRWAWLKRKWKEVKFIQGKSFPAFITNPDKYFEEAKKEFKIFTRYNAMDYYHHISIYLRNNYFSSDEAAPHLQWADKFSPPQLTNYPGVSIKNYYWTENIQDMYWNLNQTFINLECLGDNYSTLKVSLKTFTPNFSKFLVKIDKREWQGCENSFSWPLKEGENTIQARAMNKSGIKGPISKIVVKYKA